MKPEFKAQLEAERWQKFVDFLEKYRLQNLREKIAEGFKYAIFTAERDRSIEWHEKNGFPSEVCSLNLQEINGPARLGGGLPVWTFKDLSLAESFKKATATDYVLEVSQAPNGTLTFERK